MIPAAELAALQAAANAALDQTGVQVRRVSGRTATGQGQATPTYATVATVAAALGAPAPADLATYAARIAHREAYRVALPAGTGARPTDLLVFTSGLTLEVMGSVSSASYNVLDGVLAVKVG